MTIAGPRLNDPVDLSRLLAAGFERKPNDAALVSAEGRWTWRELDRVTDRLAANLLGLGLRPGDRVASLMPNRPALLIHYLACIKAALVATPLNYRYMAPEIDYALEVSGASILVAHAERSGDLAMSELVQRLPLGVVWYGAGDGRSPSLEDLLEREPDGKELPPKKPADPMVIFFTSGSTGRPKGVTHTRQTFGWILASLVRAFELTPEDIMLPGSSISHMGGFVFSLSALAVGARVDVARTFDGEEVLSLLRETQPTVLCMLPAALFAVVRDHDARCEDFRSLRLCRAGGDKVSAELEREFAELTGLVIDEGYGMTEIGVAALNPPSGTIKPGSVGRPNPGYELSIRDQGGGELPVGQEGRVWVRSPCTMLGYWGRREATEEAIRDGWLDTGDVMKVDADGYLWFFGRKKQIIVHDGSNISPQEIEDVLLEHPAVECAGVVGVHDLIHGENVRAYVSLKEGAARPACQELIRFARDRVGYKAPEEVVFLDTIPLNATGKVDRVTLKRWAEERHAPDKTAARIV